MNEEFIKDILESLPKFVLYFISFAFTFLTDTLYVMWMSRVYQRRSIRAANHSTLIYALGMISYIAVIQIDNIAGIFTLLGAWMGTVYATEIEKIRDKKLK